MSALAATPSVPVGSPGPSARRRGRPASTTRERAFSHAVGLYLRGRRIDLQLMAIELGVGRTTLHRWFGTRDDLVADVLGTTAVELLMETRGRTDAIGARGLLQTFDAFNHALLAVPALNTFLSHERDPMRFIARADRGPQPMLVTAIAELIRTQVDAHHYAPPADPDTLAYAIVRLAQSFLYADAATGVRGDLVRLRDIEAVLLGVDDARSKR
jgi:AcrR family transcriptional regulator